MRRVIFLLCAICVVGVLMQCERGPAEPTEYTHKTARFKITMPAHWSKLNEDEEMFEFRRGGMRLVEVGGFDIGIPASDFEDIPEEGIKKLIKEATQEGFLGYCEEAEINDYTIEGEDFTTWGGQLAYHIKANGYSDYAEEDMIVNIVANIHPEKSRMYMFASQIAKQYYEDIEPNLVKTIGSFKVIE
jgi:hypothetical protein